jgi:hypothetical protein
LLSSPFAFAIASVAGVVVAAASPGTLLSVAALLSPVAEAVLSSALADSPVAAATAAFFGDSLGGFFSSPPVDDDGDLAGTFFSFSFFSGFFLVARRLSVLDGVCGVAKAESEEVNENELLPLVAEDEVDDAPHKSILKPSIDESNDACFNARVREILIRRMKSVASFCSYLYYNIDSSQDKSML